jgi:hypothetical protein
MAYAPHTNTDVDHGANLPLLLGRFKHAETNVDFEYAVRPVDGVDFADDGMHIVYVADGTYRYARVLKTVAWVAIDENADGTPVWERWPLKQHDQYDTSWVRPERFRA